MSEVAGQATTLADQIALKKQDLQDARVAIDSRGDRDHQTGWWSTGNAMTMSASVLLFGLVVLLVLVYQIKRYAISEHESKLFIIVLVVVSALFLVVSGYSDSQIAPVMGLLGTIVGYILRGSQEPPGVQGGQGALGPQGPV
jgi:hypothetical protein